MALASVRDLSLIVTPPAKRLSVKTFVREAQDSVIKEAVSENCSEAVRFFICITKSKALSVLASTYRS